MSTSLTRAGLAEDLRRLGVRPGDVLLVHASLRAVGRVVAIRDVVQALRDAIGPDGTLVVPAFTPDNSDPSRWASTRGEAVPEAEWPMHRQAVPAFDPASTPSFRMGAIAEAVRTWPGAVRSDHPQTSFAALGPDAGDLMAGHEWTSHFGPGTPLARIVERGGRVLLLGVPYDVCSVFHVAEYLVPAPPVRYECVVSRGGSREWFEYEDVPLDDSDFGALGRELEASCPDLVRVGRVGRAPTRLLPMAAAVDYAVRWFGRNRVGPLSPAGC
jgi:aminoglycoside 3-N-acetyltransferase